MPADRIPDILRCCELFRRVDDERLASLGALAELRRYEKGDVIFRQGDSPPGIYIVGSGQVRVYKLNPAGKEHVLHIAGPGSTFAEVAAIGQFPCPAYAEALEAVECVLLPTARFHRAIGDNHTLCLQLMTGMAVWVKQFVGLVEDIVLRDAIGRLARYLLDQAASEVDIVELPALKRHLASHLNLTSETLSRTLRRLAEAELIEEIDNRSLRLIDRDALADVAEGLFPSV